MSKNLSRKSAAFGAVVALATTLFAGAPAQAAGETISLTPSAGTSYKTLLGNSFELSSLFGGWGSAPTALKYFVTGVTAANLETPTVTSGVSRVTGAFTSSSDTAVAADSTLGTPAGVIVPGATVVLGQKAQVKFSLASTVTATTTISVTAFVDSYSADDKIDPAGNEVKSATVNITFVKPSEVTAVTTIDAPIVGGTISETASRLVAHVTLGDINIEQMTATSNVVVDFKDNGVITSNWGDKAALYVAADKALTAYSTSGTQAQGTVTANHVYSAQAQLFSVDSGVAANAVASASDVTVTSVGTASVTRSDNVLKNSDTSYSIRTGTTGFTFTSTVKGTDANGVTAQAVGAGVPVKVTISENGIADITSSITAGGKTLTNATVGTYTDSVNFQVLTDANGKVSVPVASSAGTKDDVIVVKVQALGTSAWVDSSDVTFTWRDASATYTVSRQNSTGTTIGVKRGTSYTLSYKLTDEFGALVSTSTSTTANKRAIRITSSNLSAGAGVAIDQTVEFVNGIASLTVADASTAAATYDLTAKLRQRNSGNTAWEDNAVAEDTAVVSLQTDPTPSYLTAGKNITGKAALSTSDFPSASFSFKEISVSNTAIRLPTTGDQVISGTVLRTDGAVAVGVPVSLSAAGLLFVSDVNGTADQLFGLGSITVYTDETGHYVAKVFSQKSGKATITVTAGSLTKSVVSEWAAPGAADGTALSIIAPAYVSAGSSTTITVKLTDDFGNGVQTSTDVDRLKISVSGSGITGTIPAQTDADGLVKFYQLLGATDTGSFVITATYDADGAGTTSAKITSTATVTIGKAPVVVSASTAAVSGSTGKFYVSVTNAAAKKVVIKVAGKFVKSFTGTAAKKTVVTKATKGSKKVTVYVGGKLVATKTVTVK